MKTTRKVVAYWAQGVVAQVKLRVSKSVHLDELLSYLPDEQKEREELAFECLQHLVDVLGKESERLMAVLKWPLGHSDKLVVTHPSSLRWDEEPLSLCVVDRRVRQLYQDIEEYRITVDHTRYGINIEGVKAVYRCTKDKYALAKDTGQTPALDTLFHRQFTGVQRISMLWLMGGSII